jgi:DNA-directed RNA polymerase
MATKKMKLIDLQKKLESDMKQQGITRRTSKIMKNIEDEKESNNDYMRAIMSHGIADFTKGLEEFIERSNKGVAGRKATAVHILKRFPDLDVVSFIVFKVILDGASHVRTVTNVSLAIASQLEDELRFTYYQKANKFLYQNLENHLKDTNHRKYRRTVVTQHYRKQGYVFKKIDKTDKLRLGFLMIDIMINKLGLIKLSNSGKSKKYIQLTESAVTWINNQKLNKYIALPVYLPCVIKPRKWTNPYNGGYHSERLNHFSIVKTNSKKLLKKIAEQNPKHLYRAVNGLQETGFIVNKKVLDVALELFDRGIEVGCMMSAEPEPLPPKPYDIATNEIARKKWRHEAALIHDINAHNVSKRLQTLTILNTAEKYQDNKFFHCYQADFRGRLYALTGHFNPQGNDLAKALHLFANGDELSLDNYQWYKLYGGKLAGLTGYFQASMEFDSQCRKIAQDPFEHLDLWATQEKPFQYLAFCFDYYQFLLKARNNEKYISHLPVHLDGSNNAYQHIASLCKDNKLAKAVNLKETMFIDDVWNYDDSSKQDLYTEVLDQLLINFKSIFLANNQYVIDWLKEDINRSIIKKPILMIPYGGTNFGIVNYLERQNWKEPKTYEHYKFLTHHIRLALNQVSPSCEYVMNYLKEKAVTSWISPSGFYVQQEYKKQVGKRIQTKLGTNRIQLQIKEDTDIPDKKKLRASISANYIHSLDAANVHLAISKSRSKGLKQFITVHDSFATTAADIDKFIKIVREAFVELYTKNNCPIYKELPPIGDFNVKEVIKALYIFS